jgi:hypothetical protein
MKKTKYLKTIKLGVTLAQSKWIKRQSFTRVISEAQVVRTAIDHALGCITIHK